MEVKIYKMIYITKYNKELENKIKYLKINQKIKEEIKSDNIRILSKYFVKNNKNKTKLIINNKKCYLKELRKKKFYQIYFGICEKN